MATFLRDPGGEVPVGAGPPPGGPLLTLPELAALAQAPKRQPGTEVTVQTKPVVVGAKTPWEHMFETYDDGSHQYIARGGWRFPYLHAQVDPADQSPDYHAQGGRTLFRRFLPGVTAEQAVAPERAEAARINRDPPIYGIVGSNSNTFVGNDTARRFGQRVGDSKTPGYDSGVLWAPFPVDPLVPTT